MPDVSVRQDAPSSVPNAIAGAPDVRPSPAAPTNEAADVVSAALNHAAQTPTPAGADPASQLIRQRNVTPEGGPSREALC
jgi:hypothetical protein